MLKNGRSMRCGGWCTSWACARRVDPRHPGVRTCFTWSTRRHGGATGWCTRGPLAMAEPRSYLAPYVFRVAIGNHRIVSCEDGNVTFTYRRVGSKRLRKMSLDAMKFLRRFLQHVLPAGFQKGTGTLRIPGAPIVGDYRSRWCDGW